MTHAYTAIEQDRTALIFIEFQAEWLAEDGTLFNLLIQDKKAFRDAVVKAECVLTTARNNNWTIAHAGLDLRDDPNYQLFAGGKDMLGLRAAIPRAGTWTGNGAKFFPPFIPIQGKFVAHGRSGASVLKHSNLDAMLRNNRVDTILLMGFATHVCVESTLREAHDIGLNAYVVTDACAAFTCAQDEYFRKNILPHFGAEITSESLIQLINA